MNLLILVTYNLLLFLLSPLIILLLLWRLLVAGKSRRGLFERLGFIPRGKLPAGPRCWVHAVSVGENTAAKPVWQALLSLFPDHQLLLSTTTDTGQATAAKFVGGQGHTIYFPFDLLPCAWLALARARPAVIVIMETELWPNFLAMAKLFGCKVMVANGIISDRSLRGAARLRPLYRWMAGNIDRFCMQSREDADRIVRLGADPARVMVAGNTKFDEVLTEVSLGEQITLRNALGLGRDEPILLAGSTHPGEEEPVLRAFRQVKAAHHGARLLIAPRHIQRAGEIAELITAHGFAAARRTKINAVSAPPDAVIILDTLGELARAYALCTAAFVGGSFVPIGGHNILEPAVLAKPVVFGPYMFNFRDITKLFLKHQAAISVRNSAELKLKLKELLDNPRQAEDFGCRGRALISDNRGATRKNLESIKAFLPKL